MKNNKEPKIDYLFEVSWEICHKIGGIYTAISTKYPSLQKNVKTHIMIGPDVVREIDDSKFIEDNDLLKVWKAQASRDGLRVRVGHWDIKGKPIAILIDFTNLFVEKDQIFKELWEQYKLDSISGQWDYIEPALFGYASGKVIEHLSTFHVSRRSKIVAHFHEWATGAGLLYLRKHTPQIGCVFTGHATVLGRSIATHGLPLYEDLKTYNVDSKTREFNIVAKHSLEKLTAHTADCFTSISEITSHESEYLLGKKADILTPNGFTQSIIEQEKKGDAEFIIGKEKLSKVAAAMLSTPLAENTIFVGLTAHYEFKNKGIDVYINSLGQLNKNAELDREIVAFLFVPAEHHGASKELLYKLNNNTNEIQLTNKYTTHYLIDPEDDIILQSIKAAGLNNSPNDKVKIIFVPAFINGADGVFNLPYYNLLMAHNITIYPSYYEPWGYTPIESLAFAVPTIISSVSGVGSNLKASNTGPHPSITIIERNDNNKQEAINDVEKRVLEFSKLNDTEIEALYKNTEEVSDLFLWERLIPAHLEAYKIALEKATERTLLDVSQPQIESVSYINKQSSIEQPKWTDVIVQRKLPTILAPLNELSKNLWWCWNQEAIALFKYIDQKTFTQTNRNPIALLDSISATRYQELSQDQTFILKLNEVYKDFKEYMNAKKHMTGPQIAYFCMEYGLQASLKIYSGGLGILAGDYLKEASDKSTRMTAVGFLYRYGYFTQKISATGMQIAEYEAQDFTKIPVSPVRHADGHWITAKVAFPGRTVYSRLWKVEVGRTDLYLLDTDFEDNRPEDRAISHQLYGGDWENRLKQELILGIGGIRALKELGIKADVYHCNEGHAAFIGLERIHELVESKNLTFNEALEVIRSSSLFTTHTPVPAGHDAFDEDLLRKYISHYPSRFGVSWQYLMGLGKNNPNNNQEKFSMSILAANLSQEVNGVSQLHGKVSQEIMKNMWTGYMPEELHISYVTNGVHLPTWAAPQWKEIFNQKFGEDFRLHHYDKKCFEKIFEVPDKDVWEIRKDLKQNLINHIRARVSGNENIVHFTPEQVIKISKTLDPGKLTIGFARRFATYKRANLLFKNIDRLEQILNNPERPVQLLFAGKAHPADGAGQDLIKTIMGYSKLPQFMGKIIFLDNYDMELARRMVQGVDIWLNTPTRPLEASGTSGEKAVLNGVMHFSVLDGWWVEGYREDSGWSLPLERSYENQDFQDQMDSEMIYNIIENDIAPLYYNRNKADIPAQWINMIKNSIAYVASNFTTNRMLVDYEDRFYNKLAKRHTMLCKNDFEKAIQIAEWKKNVSREWDNISVISASRLDVGKEPIVLGKIYDVEVVLNIGLLKPEDVGVEVVFAENKNGVITVTETKEFTTTEVEGSTVTYTSKIEMEKPGTYLASYRVFPKSKYLPHRQDFGLVKWL